MQSRRSTLTYRILSLLVLPALLLSPMQALAQPSRGLAPQIGTPGGAGAGTSSSATVNSQDQVIEDVRFDRKLDAPMPMDATFRDSTGKTVQLKQYFGEKPVVFMLIFYNCTMLCSEVMNGALRLMKDKQLGFEIGRDYEVVTVSIDPTETPELAAAKKKNYLKELGNPAGGEAGWHLLVGDKVNIDKVANAVGYHYSYDPKTEQYAHPGGLVVATPDGRVARYFYGVDYPAREVRFGLIEASHNKIGSAVEKAVLFLCFHYNPTDGKYSLGIMKIVRLGAACTILGIIFAIWMMRRAEARAIQRRLQRKEAAPPAPAVSS
jgi:protein SCO1/2